MGQERGLKRRKPLSNAIKIELWMALHDLATETRVNKSRLLDEAIEDLLVKHGREDLIERSKVNK